MDKARILIVEDDPDLTEMLVEYFQSKDYEVLTAAWGQDALKISNDEGLNAILLDIHLPDITGYDVCRQLRMQRRTQNVPILFLTERRERVDKLQGLQLGVIDYVTKPFDIQELSLRIRNAIQRASSTIPLNPITELPEAAVLDEKLAELLTAETPWALMILSIRGLDRLCEQSSFVAVDETRRAITLMLRNALREFGGEDDMLFHLTDDSFVLLTRVERIGGIRARIESRLQGSLGHFYHPYEQNPRKDDYLRVDIGVLDHTSGSYDDIATLKQRLLDALPQR